MNLRSASEQATPHVPVQQRVQAAVLVQFIDDGTACPSRTAALCPSTDSRDLEIALAYLIEDGSIDSRGAWMTSLVELAGDGSLALTVRGRQRQHEDAA